MNKKLEGLTFVVTGVLEEWTRLEAEEFIESCGGKMVGSVSKNTDYLVVGDKPGASKLGKARQFGTKILNQVELFELATADGA